MTNTPPYKLPEFKRIKTIKNKNAAYLNVYLDDLYLLSCFESDIDMIADAINEYDGKIHKCEYEDWSIYYQLHSDEWKWVLTAYGKHQGLMVAQNVNRDYLEAVLYAVLSSEQIINYYDDLLGTHNEDKMSAEELEAYNDMANLPELKKDESV